VKRLSFNILGEPLPGGGCSNERPRLNRLWGAFVCPFTDDLAAATATCSLIRLVANLLSGLPANILRATFIGFAAVGTCNFTVVLSHF
jgi:hypothetical protein